MVGLLYILDINHFITLTYNKYTGLDANSFPMAPGQ